MNNSTNLPDIWLIDDTQHWHEVTQRTLARVGGWNFTGFCTATAGLMAYHHLLASRDTRRFPRIILCDFYLDAGWRGDAVCQELRREEAAQASNDHRAIIVGHSTSPIGSQCIVNAGADCIIAKHGEDHNRSLEKFLRSFHQ